MISTFFGIDIASRAIQTATDDIDVTGQNVANASTTGYTEEVAQNTATDPYTQPMLNNPEPAQFGTGVEVSQITRQTEPWVNQQVNTSDSTLNYWQNLNNQLQVAQTAFQEPTTIGLQSALDNFFNSWQTLSGDPTNMGARATVVSDAQQVIDDFHTGSGLLSQTADNIQSQMTADVNGSGGSPGLINQLATQIAALNQQIASVSAQGEQPNDLEDSRDQLVNQLSQLAPVTVKNYDNGTADVSIFGDQLVAASSSVANTVALTLASSTIPNSYLSIAGTTAPVYLSGTSLSSSYATAGGLTGLEAAYQKTEGYLGQFDTLAYNLAQEVNMQHQEGANGQNLVTSGSTTISSGSFDLQVGGGTTVAVGFTNTAGTNLGLLQGMASAINSASTLGVTATVVTDAQTGTSYLNVVSSTSVPTSVALSDVSGGDAVAYTGGSQGYTSTYDYNGKPGGLFFAPLSTSVGAAGNIGLSTNISPSAGGGNPNLDNIAAAATSSDPRDGTNAAAMGNLQNAAWGNLNNSTFDSYYQTTTETVGADVQNATNMQNTASSTNTQLVNMQQSVSGVSTDAEMTKLVQFQYAYQAAAQFLSVQSKMLDTLINGTLSGG